jgi:predicted phosphodiesterase
MNARPTSDRRDYAGIYLLLSAAILCLCTACAGLPRGAPPKAPSLEYPAARFAVLADPHLLDPALIAEGTDLGRHLSALKQMIGESESILEQAVGQVLSEAPDFVLVCGDLTKDGEASSHRLCARQLARLRQTGIRVLVVPGNHDVLNSHAVRYDGGRALRVPSVSPEEFREIYGACGYGQSLESDPDSLSYLAEPVPGLRVLALDSCKYREQTGAPTACGRLYPATLRWVERVLARSRLEGKPVIAFLHHQLLEHFQTEGKYLPENLLENRSELAEVLRRGGVKVVLTGHEHAQDVTLAGGLFDVTTASLISHPCAYRIVELADGWRMRIHTRRLTATAERPEGLPTCARELFRSGVEETARVTLAGYKVSEKDIRLIAPQAAAAFVAHHAGDEQPPGTLLDSSGLGPWARIVLGPMKGLLVGLWTDLEPPDNDLEIDLATGAWQVP